MYQMDLVRLQNLGNWLVKFLFHNKAVFFGLHICFQTINYHTLDNKNVALNSQVLGGEEVDLYLIL